MEWSCETAVVVSSRAFAVAAKCSLERDVWSTMFPAVVREATLDLCVKSYAGIVMWNGSEGNADTQTTVWQCDEEE